MFELVMYGGIFGLSCCKRLLAQYKWFNYLLIGLYLCAEYVSALRRGRIEPPCIRQFITICIGTGLLMLYYASEINNELNSSIHQLFLVVIMVATMYVYSKVNAKAPKPDTEYLLGKYKRIRMPVDTPKDCVICLDPVTFVHIALACKHCKQSFHKKCLWKWCNESAVCPHCRHDYG